MSSTNIPKPKFYSIGAKNMTPTTRLRILKDTLNIKNDRTPMTDRTMGTIKEQPSEKLVKEFDGLNFDSAKKKPKKNLLNDVNTCTPTVHKSIAKLGSTPCQKSHYDSHVHGGSVPKKIPSNFTKSTSQATNSGQPRTQTTTCKHNNDVINPRVNGVDYSDMIKRKEEFKYTGPGYIVEFNCHPKYLSTLVVQKGLWRVTSQPNYVPADNCVDIGPPIYISRIDKNPAKATPNKFTNYQFDWRPQFFNTSEKAYHSTTQNLDLEINPKNCKSKKSLKWDSNLEQVVESGFKHHSPHLDKMNPSSRKMRKSFSHNEIVGLTDFDYDKLMKSLSSENIDDDNEDENVYDKHSNGIIPYKQDYMDDMDDIKELEEPRELDEQTDEEHDLVLQKLKEHAIMAFKDLELYYSIRPLTALDVLEKINLYDVGMNDIIERYDAFKEFLKSRINK